MPGTMSAVPRWPAILIGDELSGSGTQTLAVPPSCL
jgi:hypothetical protein